MKRVTLLLAALALVLGGVGPAVAGPIVYSGFDNGANSTDPRPNSNAAKAAFDLAVGATSLITFETSPLGNFVNLVVGSGVTADSGEIRNTPSGSPDSLYGYNTTAGGSQFLSRFGGDLIFTFSTPIDAFGAYFSGIQSQASGQETITYTDGSTETVNIPNTSMPDGGVAFVGFSDVGKQIASVQLHFLNDIVGVDDVQYRAGAVPEPGTLTMLGMASASFAGYFGWRRRKQPVSA